MRADPLEGISLTLGMSLALVAAHAWRQRWLDPYVG